MKKLPLFCLMTAVITTTNTAWACETPKANGYDKVFCLFEGLAGVEKDGKRGYVNKSGKIVIPVQYEQSSGFYEGLAAVKKQDKWGYIDKTGKVVIDFQYEYFNDFSDGLVSVKKNGKWGYLNKTGKVVIPFEYDNARSFHNGLAAVQKNNRTEFIDKTGNDFFDEVYKFNDGLAIVTKNKKNGLIDKIGKMVIPLTYDTIDYVGDGKEYFYFGEKDGKYYFFDTKGQIIPPSPYDKINNTGIGLIYIKKGEKFGLIDTTTGKLSVPAIYDDMDWFTGYDENLLRVKKDGKYGYLNRQHQLAIPLVYDEARRFSDGLAYVENSTTQGFINPEGNLVLDLTKLGYNNFSFKTHFEDGLLEVTINGKNSYINKTGKIVNRE